MKRKKKLAEEVTETVHGEQERESAKKLSEALFKNQYDEFSKKEMEDLFLVLHSLVLTLPKSKIENREINIERLAVDYGLARSLSDARRLTDAGGLYLNMERVDDPTRLITPQDLYYGEMFFLRRGRRERRLIRVV